MGHFLVPGTVEYFDHFPPCTCTSPLSLRKITPILQRAKKKQKSKKKKEGTGGSSNDEAKEAGRSPQRVEEAHPAGGDTDADSDGAPEVADLD